MPISDHPSLSPLSFSDLPSLVRLHYEVLPGEFLTSQSPSFLLGFYQNLFPEKGTAFIGAWNGKDLTGAIIGLGKTYHPSLKSYLNSLLLVIKHAPLFLRHPRRLRLLLESFLFKIKSPQETEIFFIGVKKEARGLGVGKQLVSHLEKKFQKTYPALCVDCKCKLPSNNFYQKLGFKIKDTFTLYGESWNRYEKKL